MDRHSNEATLRDYIRVFFKHKFLIIAIVIPVVTINYIILEFKTPAYNASVKMLVSGTKQIEAVYYKNLGRYAGLVQYHAEFLRSRSVVERVVQSLKLYERPDDYEMRYASLLKAWWMKYNIKRGESLQMKRNLDPEEEKNRRINLAINNLSSNINIEHVEQTDVFYLNVRDFDSGSAILIANAISRSYLIFDLEQQISEFKLKYGTKNSIVKQVQTYIDELYTTLEGKPLTEIDVLNRASVKIIDQAGAQIIRSKSKGKTLLIALLGGLMFGGVFSIVLEFFDQRFKSSYDIEAYLKTNFLGAIPKYKGNEKLIIEDSKQMADYKSTFQNISERISMLRMDGQPKSFLITNTNLSLQVSVIATNICLCLGRKTKNKILMIDADLRNSSLSKVLDITDNPGLVEVLEGNVALTYVIHDFGFGLDIVPSGKTGGNSTNLLLSKKMSDTIKKAYEIYDMIFIVCSGLKNYQDAVAISYLTDCTILVIDAEKDRRQSVKFAIKPLEQNNVKIIGAVLSNSKHFIPEFIYKIT